MRPQLFDYLHGYDGRAFVHNLLAGITVAIVALPLAVGFAIASGVTPAQGLRTAIVAGFPISGLRRRGVPVALIFLLILARELLSVSCERSGISSESVSFRS